MTVVVTHTTPADSSFSTAGAAAWNANHTLSGVGTMAGQDSNAVAITGGSISGVSGVVTSVTGTAPVVSSGGATPAISMAAATTSVSGYLTSTDWNTFNGKGSGSVTSVGGTGTVNGLSLSGTVTSSGNLTFGGTLDLSSPPAIGGTTPAAGTFTTLIGGSGSANYEQITGGATGKAVQFQSLGTDTNISLAIQSKGTGAIDLAAGSSGVNISNGGTVTAITGVTGGSYTLIPTITISAPTTAGGVQATGTVAMLALATTLVSGGSGYAALDTITLTGGTFSQAIVLRVDTVSAGAILTFTVTNGGTYTVLPTNPIAQGSTSGSGSGATFSSTWQVRTTAFTITNAGSGYVEQPTITFSSGTATAYATVGSANIIKSLGASTVSAVGTASFVFQTPNTVVPAFIIREAAGADSFVMLNPQSAYTNLVAQGNANAILGLYANGTGYVALGTAGTTNTNQMRVSHTASAVNYVQVTGAATGAGVLISSQGSDAAVNLGLQAKAAGVIRFFTGNGAENFRISSVSSAVNYIAVSGSIAGASPTFTTTGTDADIDLTLTPKGAGTVRFGTYTASALLAVAGYITIKDSGGTTRRLLVG